MKFEKEKIINQSVQYLKSVGPKRAESFKKIGIETIRDLLFYFPTRHLDRTTTLLSAKALEYIESGFDGEITVIGKIIDTEKIYFGKKEIFKVQLRDSSGFFECVWFQGIKYFDSLFKEGEFLAVSGKPSISKYGSLQFVHPDFDRISEDESNSFLNTGKIIPFYKIPKELKKTNIGDLSLRRIINHAVEEYADLLEETLPENILEKHNLINIVDAVKKFHFPENKSDIQKAVNRFKFEEIFFLELLIALRKHNYKTVQPGFSMPVKTNLVANFLKTIPFKLTEAQLKVLREIRRDMEAPQPMNRLLQGDVGSGKTIVALIAMLIAVDNGFQAILMAPTEILADQHAKNFSKLLEKLSEIHLDRKINISLLTGGQKKSLRKKTLHEIEMKEANIIIGTHALLEENVKFKNAGLIIVDEQHRFGVEQRAKLQSKGIAPDVIVMSATPIPRTLSLTLYGDLDVSVIDEIPKDRKPIKTILRSEEKLPDIYKFIIDNVKKNNQAFIVYPLVEESEKLELKAAQTYFEELSSNYLKNLNIGLIHGKMSWQEKEETMFHFLKKKYDVLVATTVIEVGIDIPDANIILINDAHRFGLSQLHQLRGRVGRGNRQAYCILVTKDDYVAFSNKSDINLEYLSSSQLERYRSSIRLHTMVNYNDGFKIAEIDLKLRGPGNIFGTQQTGFPELKFIDMTKDLEIIIKAKQEAFNIIENDPHLLSTSNLVIRKNLITHYSNNLQYAKIA